MSCSGATGCDTDLTNEDVDRIKKQWQEFYRKQDREGKDHVCTSDHQACYLCLILGVTCTVYDKKKEQTK